VINAFPVRTAARIVLLRLRRNGLVAVKSPHSVKETAGRLESALKEKGVNVIARVNHAQAAKKAEMDLRATEVVIFGNAKTGTPLMQCAQTIGIDLPQKALVWEDEKGQVWLAYNDQQYLAKRHGIAGAMPQ
jgi:uncharacterized protein (DUF302 family)